MPKSNMIQMESCLKTSRAYAALALVTRSPSYLKRARMALALFYKIKKRQESYNTNTLTDFIINKKGA